MQEILNDVLAKTAFSGQQFQSNIHLRTIFHWIISDGCALGIRWNNNRDSLNAFRGDWGFESLFKGALLPKHNRFVTKPWKETNLYRVTVTQRHRSFLSVRCFSWCCVLAGEENNPRTAVVFKSRFNQKQRRGKGFVCGPTYELYRVKSLFAASSHQVYALFEKQLPCHLKVMLSHRWRSDWL